MASQKPKRLSFTQSQQQKLKNQIMDKAERTARNRGADPWKGPKPKNSRTSAPVSNTQMRTDNKPLTLPNSAKAGKNLIKEGAANLRNSTQGPTQRGAKPPVKPSGTYRAPNIPKPASGAAGGGVRGRAAGGVTGALIGIEAGRALGNAIGGAYTRAIRNEQAVRMSSDGGRYVPGDQQRPTPAPAKPKPKPPKASRPAPTQSGGGSTPNRGGGGSPSRSMPRAVTRSSSGPAPDAGMKNQDKNYRGNLFEKTFGYKPGQAPDQTKGSSKQLDTKSDIYTPTTKVDGSQYADKKPDMKKVDEYNRRKRRYYD